jgi:Transposase DDE domain
MRLGRNQWRFYPIMNTSIQLYETIKQKVQFLYVKLKLHLREKTKGRKLALSIPDILSLALFKQKNQIATKKSLFAIFEEKLGCSYKTLVVNLNRFAKLAGIMLALLLFANRKDDHPVKHTDSTDIPVCSLRKAKRHKTMAFFAHWGKTGKGWFYGLKLHFTANLKKKLLALAFTSGNVDDRAVTVKLNKGLFGIFAADAGYVSEKLAREFHIEHKRFLFAKPRANMKKLATKFQTWLYGTRMQIEIHPRALKMFYGLVTSMPRSANGYFANYIYSLLAYQLA